MRARRSSSRPPLGSEEWRRARTLADACVLGARFVEGELDVFPGWGSPALDRESDELVPTLAALNRAGFLTLASQPGGIERAADGTLRRQRAFVFGFASDEVATRLAGLDAEGEIAIAVFRADAGAGGAHTAVSERAGEPYAFAGYPAFDEELECFAGSCCAALLDALRRSAFASAIDLEWGRRERLWTSLARALNPASTTY